MDLYFVQIEGRPTSGSEEFGQVGGARIEIFVQADSLAEAATKSIAHVMSRNWVVTSQLAAVLQTPERIAGLDTVPRKMCDRAMNEGLYSFFTAWPVKDRKDNMVEVRPLRDTDKSDPTQH